MTAQEFFKNDRFATNAGVELIEIKEGYSKARLVITAEHLNAGGRTQGGAIFTLADLALAAAANSHGTLAFSLFVQYHLPAQQRTGRCTVCRSTRTLHRPHHRILPDRRHQPGGKTDCHFRIQCI